MHQPLWARRDLPAVAATAFLAANLLHGLDHGRQRLEGLNAGILAIGTLLTVAAFVVARAEWRRDPAAPRLAAWVGLSAAFLIALGHIAPHWGTLSASYVDDIDADALAWAVMLLEVSTALLVGIVGVLALRRRAVTGTAA